MNFQNSLNCQPVEHDFNALQSIEYVCTDINFIQACTITKLHTDLK